MAIDDVNTENRQHHAQLVRDLQWVLSSPSLLSAGSERQDVVDCLSATFPELCGSQLSDFLSENLSGQQHKVGRYFEQLVHFYLQALRRFEIVAAGRQVKNDERTIGELDFVFRDEDKRLCHWEVAVKFYLYFPQQNWTGSYLIGPNSNDTFEKKTSRLFEHQLPLSELVFPDVARRAALVRGRIFYNPKFPYSEPLPHRLSEEHLRSQWLFARQCEILADISRSHDNVHAQIQPKPFWLSPEKLSASSPLVSRLLSLDRMIEHVRNEVDSTRKPRLVSLLSNMSGDWLEFERVFVMPDAWPAQP